MNATREIGYALLRVTLGVIFLTTGLVKLSMGMASFRMVLQQQFADALPSFIVTPFAYALPVVEVAIGAMLVIGLFNAIALIVAGVLLIVLTFGKTVINDTATVAGNLSYQLIVFVLLWCVHHNGYSVDRFRERRQSGEK